MESLSNDKVLTYLKEVETAAEDVLTDKQEIVDLDRKRNQNREALRAVQKAAEADYKGDASKVWMATGNTFIKMPSSAAKDMLKSGEDIFFTGGAGLRLITVVVEEKFKIIASMGRHYIT